MYNDHVNFTEDEKMAFFIYQFMGNDAKPWINLQKEEGEWKSKAAKFCLANFMSVSELTGLVSSTHNPGGAFFVLFFFFCFFLIFFFFFFFFF